MYTVIELAINLELAVLLPSPPAQKEPRAALLLEDAGLPSC